MQQWEVEERGSNGYRLHAVPKPSYVLDCSDGSISTSYKNNAHMCAETGTTDVDCAVEFEYVGGNQVRIHLGQKGLCLTATTVAENDAELSNNISTSAALRGGKEGRGNVYWKTPADEGSMTWKKQCWEVIEVDGGTDPDPKPEPEPGDGAITSDVIVSHVGDPYLSQRESSTWTECAGILPVDTLKGFGCSAVSATIVAHIMEKDNSITTRDLYDWGVWEIKDGYPYANWAQNSSCPLHFTYETTAIAGWSAAKGIIFDEILADRPVVIWLNNTAVNGTHFVVGYGLKRGASRDGLQYDQVMVYNPYPVDNPIIHEKGTLADMMKYNRWKNFGSVRRVFPK